MRQIPPHPLWLGHVGEGRDYRQLFQVGIKALVELALEEPASQPPRELIYCRFPLLDGTGNDADLFDLSTATLVTLLRTHTPTLVCCSLGMSRAPTLAAAALALLLKTPADECLRRIQEHHPSDVSPALWSEVVAFVESRRS